MSRKPLVPKLKPGYKELFEENKHNLEELKRKYSFRDLIDFHREYPEFIIGHLMTGGLSLAIISGACFYDTHQFKKQYKIWKEYYQ